MLKKSTILFFALLCLAESVSAARMPKNVIFLIGDGMGIAQIYAAMVSNGNSLELERLKHLGYSKTYSSDKFTTDSGAGGTALSTGVKTKNGMIGMSPDSVCVETILQQADRNGLATGIVVACAVTHATPASFIAHQVNRNMYEEIAADYLNTDIDVFIGGGKKHFENRKDKRNLIEELKSKDYQIAYSIDEVKKTNKGKLAGLLYEEHPPVASVRSDFLPEATMSAIHILNNNKTGFFLMVEGSQIDWGGHDNDIDMVVNEMLDFDKTIGKVLDFAEKDGNTLVIVTADHETGGLTLPTGNIEKRNVKANFSTKSHTGVPVPVFAFGPGAEEFTGFMENTDFKNKIAKLLKLR
ncbi:MAG: alkaline phosphatase [Paludibacter sp.]|nr:alkaline phosphatase [Paludibacter sp.]